MNGVQPETMLALRDAAAMCKVNQATIWRWCRKGLSVGAVNVKLRFIRLGGRVFVTLGWIDAFNAELTARHAEAEMLRKSSAVPTHADATNYLNKEGM